MTDQSDAARRRQRKVEHVRHALYGLSNPTATWFDEVFLVHNCLPETDLDRIDTRTVFCGREVGAPIIINAMTGGAPELTELNRELARVAAQFGLPMAVGSQMAALQDQAVAESYTVVREVNPTGVIIANIGAGASVEQAAAAVAMLRADALQVHLNAAQELAMSEGDRSFRGQLARVAAMARHCSVPVIVKETGSGIAGAEAARLAAAGIRAIDLGGYGGTNFVAIEQGRRGNVQTTPFASWGIPTAVSLVEVLQSVGENVSVVASGGVEDGLIAAKCLALGATACGVARPFLRALVEHGPEGLQAAVAGLLGELRTAMALVGAHRVEQMRQAPVVVMGRPAEWLTRRGYAVDHYAHRSGGQFRRGNIWAQKA